MDEEMFIGSLAAHEGPRAAIVWMRAEARARRRPPRRNLKTPEYRALDQIVAEAEAAGNIPVAIGPAGILEIVAYGDVAFDATFTPCAVHKVRN